MGQAEFDSGAHGLVLLSHYLTQLVRGYLSYQVA